MSSERSRLALRERVSVQRVSTGYEHVLFAVEFVSYGGGGHPADTLVPQCRAVAGSNGQQVPRGIAGDCQASRGGEYAGRRAAFSIRVLPHDFAGPIIDRA